MKRAIVGLSLVLSALAPHASAATDDAARLVAAMLGETPLVEDVRSLTDVVGGRPTGSEANLRSVEWAVERFREAGVDVRREAFEMSALWLERSARGRIEGGAEFDVNLAAMPFSISTEDGGLTAPLVDGKRGSIRDFERLGDAARGAFVLIEMDELSDIAGLFKEYTDAAAIERRAFDAGVAGVVYMGSRPRNVLHRHNSSRGPQNEHPMLIMERTSAQRALRLLRSGRELRLTAEIDLESGGPYQAENVIGEIRGSQTPEEVVVIGAHLDSWGLGTGALDNGCNVALVIDIARQIQRLGLEPRRTIRFALFNGEEQGLQGSWGYTKRHADELDRHVMASSFDIGSGRITGFFTNGREELLAFLDEALRPVGGLGPFQNLNIPIVGTDNFDFMLEGVANLVANQESANYGPNYHAGTDTFDKVDQEQLRLNSAVAAAVAWGFANQDVGWERQSRDEIQALIEETDLGRQMETFGLLSAWESRARGRQD